MRCSYDMPPEREGVGEGERKRARGREREREKRRMLAPLDATTSHGQTSPKEHDDRSCFGNSKTRQARGTYLLLGGLRRLGKPHAPVSDKEPLRVEARDGRLAGREREERP